LGFIKELKSNRETNKIKIVVFSGYGDEEIKKEALKSGADKYMPKSEYMPQELVEVVKKLVEL